jgi:polygalacturonase
MTRRIFSVSTLAALSAALVTTTQAQTLATGDSRVVSKPSYPTVCAKLQAKFSTSQRASPPAAASDDTVRVQKALTDCAGTGQSVVLEASGSNNAFFTNLLKVNGEGLVINGGVTLYGNDSYSSAANLLTITGDKSSLMGPGVVDGRQDLIGGTPRLVQTNNATNLTIYNVTLQQAAKMNLYVKGGNGFTAWGVNIRTPATVANADGIDLDSVTNATVTKSSIESGDDGIAIKTNGGAASNITVSNNKLYGTHGLSIGSQTMHGVTNVLFNRNYVYGQDLQGTYSTNNNAINIKTDAACGGVIQQVTYQNTCITHGKHLIVLDTHYGTCAGKAGTPQMKNIVINGVYAINSQAGGYSLFNGYDASHPLDTYLAYVSLDATAIASASQYAKVKLYQSNVSPKGTGITVAPFSATGSIPSCSF